MSQAVSKRFVLFSLLNSPKPSPHKPRATVYNNKQQYATHTTSTMLEDYGTDENMGGTDASEFTHLLKDDNIVDDEARANDPLFMAPHLREGLPPVTCNYGKADYWDGRYMKAKETFEWYHEYPEIKEILNMYAAKDGRILMAGCGNSRLSEDMYYDGYGEIVNVDLSRVVVDSMGIKYADIPALTWKQMDVSDVPFEEIEFDCVIDKACLDAVFCADLALKKVKKYCHEMDRILKHGGAWIIISHGLPEDRMQHFENDDAQSGDFLSFDCNVHAVAKPLTNPYGVADLKDPDELYFIYVCIKNPAKAKQKDDKANRIYAQDEGKKALTKKLKELRDKQNKEGHLAVTPTRDAFGNPRRVAVGAGAANTVADLVGNLDDNLPG